MTTKSPFEEAFAQGPYDPEPGRETVRGRITLASACTFFFAVAFYLTASLMATPGAWPQIKEAMGVMLPAITSVLGTSLGFYFGSQKR